MKLDKSKSRRGIYPLSSEIIKKKSTSDKKTDSKESFFHNLLSQSVFFSFFNPFINISATSGRVNWGGGVNPFLSISLTFVPERCR